MRKSGGTSVNEAFLSLLDGDGRNTYAALAASRDNRLLRFDGRTVVGWNERLLEAGRYFYGFSHAPLHRLSIPPQTFTITVLRDPADRVVSHYRMLLAMLQSDSDHPAFAEERHWLGDGFSSLLDRMPRHHLCNQLWMFSAGYDPTEAVERLASIKAVMRTGELGDGMLEVGRRLGLPLSPQHVRAASVPFTLGDSDRARLRELLEPEYEMLSLAESHGLLGSIPRV